MFYKSFLLISLVFLSVSAARAEKVLAPESTANPYYGFGETTTVQTSKGSVSVTAPHINRTEEERLAMEQQGVDIQRVGVSSRQSDLPISAIVSFRGKECPIGWTLFLYFGDFRPYGIVTCEKV